MDMATSTTDVWTTLQRGDWRDARNASRRIEDDHVSDLGLAASALAAGQAETSLDFAQRAHASGPSPASTLMLARAHSENANRQEAARLLEQYLDEAGPEAYPLALLGEQRIRTAQWDDGKECYIDALNRDDRGWAARQLGPVLSDLSLVVNSGRLPADRAKQFINGVDYNVGAKSPRTQQLLAAARRALNKGRPMDEPSGPDPIFDVLEDLTSGRGSTTPSPPQQDEPPERDEPPPEAGPPQEESSGMLSSEESKGIEAKQKDLAAVIQKDRRKNEDLQDQVGPMGPPDWPSSPEAGDIDPLAPMAWEEQSIFVGEPDMDTSQFRITSGSVRTQIFLERCLQNLLTAAKQERTVSIQFRPESITELELNCWDGLLKDLQPASDIYEEHLEEGSYEAYAVGRFIGECLAMPYDGTWAYGETPEETRLNIGDTVMDPLGLALRWHQAQDQDDVVLERIAVRARRAAEAGSAMMVEQDYIDPSRELQGHSLEIKLAEMWANQLYRLSETPYADIAESIEVQSHNEDAVIFLMGRAWCPRQVADRDRVPMAYLRSTGQFLVLTSPKHLGLLLDATVDALQSADTERLAGWVARHHRPDWQFVLDEEDARSLQEQTGRDSIQPPRIGTLEDATVLQMWAWTGSELQRLRLHFRPDADLAWSVETVAYSAA
jgi:tetratricopeptide (TPR) repeat protein